VTKSAQPKKSLSSFQEKRAKGNLSELVNEISNEIEIGVLFGEYKPREHLVQDRLAKKYSVERNIIRAALRDLEEKGVLVHFHNQGSMVKYLTVKNAKKLYFIRFLLEGTAAELAVANVTRKIIRQLESLSEEMENHLQQNEQRAFTFAHERFHQVIFETADNSYLLKMIMELRSASASIRNFSYSRYALPEIKNQLFHEHKKMISFLKKGDEKKIAEISRSHIKAGINYYLRILFPGESLIG
jgi:DNA-binding GntR family transcriptional regulator